jgi:hypothetical protein
LLSNRAYVGDVVLGTRVADDDAPGRSILRPTEERWGMENAHPAIIERETFALVAAKLAENAGAPRRSGSEYMLSGILTCARCGRLYKGGGWYRSSQDAARKYYYRCAGVEKPRVCASTVLSRELADSVVVESLARLLSRPTIRDRIVTKIDAQIASIAAAEADPSLVDAERRALERQSRLAAAVADGIMTRDEVAGQMSVVRSELARISELKTHERIAAARRTAILGERDQIIAHILDAPTRLRTAEGPALRAQLTWWCQSLVYDDSRRIIHMSVNARVSRVVHGGVAPSVLASCNHRPVGPEYSVLEAAGAAFPIAVAKIAVPRGGR